MADDINLPNLISHLQVNLGNTNGLVADATRQGSSVGEALGQAMQRTLRAAVDDIPDVEINADTSQADRDLHRVRGELNDLANARIGVDISIEEALRRMAELEPHLERLQNTHPSVNVRAFVGGALADLEELREVARRVDDTEIEFEVDVDTRGFRARLEEVRRTLGRVGSAAAGLGAVAALGAKASAAIGALVPLVAGLVATLANIAPAAAVGLSGIVALQLATNTFKIAMSGVGDAVKAALDPSDAEAYAEALKKLSPNARSFVQAIRAASPAIEAIKKSVQDKVFAGLDKQLTSTAKTTLPVFRKALDHTAGTLNRMGKGVLTAVRGLAKDGVLGTALKGATSGLREFSRAPGQIVTALGQIAAAAAPAFARLSKAGGRALDKLSEKLTKSFESGGMEKAIEKAIALIAQLGRVIGNIGSIIGSVFRAADASGGGFLGTLEAVTKEIARIAKTDEVQTALKSLFSVMAKLGTTVAPLLGQALTAVLPVLTALGPPVETLIGTLGSALGPIIKALGPVLQAAAQAVGELVVALAPLLTLAGSLVTSLLPGLTPLLAGLGDIFRTVAPLIQQVTDLLGSLFLPVLQQLPDVLAQLMPVFTNFAAEVFPQLTQQLGFMAPAFADLGLQIADLVVAAAPLIVQILELATVMASQLVPLINGTVVGTLTLLAGSLTGLGQLIEDYVIPAMKLFVGVLNGDVFDATTTAGRQVRDFAEAARTKISELASSAQDRFGAYAQAAKTKFNEAKDSAVSAARDMVSDAVSYLSDLPGRAANALGGLGHVLFGAGASLISGFIDGIQSKIGSVRSTLGNLTSMIPNWKGPKKKDATLLTPAGKSIIKGLVDGIDASTSSLKSKLTSITNLIERAITINKGNKHKISGLSTLLSQVEKDNKKILSLAKQRDSVATKLKAAQTKLNDALKQRSDAAAQIKQGILGDANITTGNNVVNSVSAITIGLQQAVAKAKDFATNLAKLKKAGLRTDLLDDIASAGLDGGAATAEALAKATPAELKKINDLQAQLTKSAGASGTTVAGAMYDAGVKAAQGLVNGLKKQQATIEKQMEKIAAAMVKAIKKKLGIHSPSRVATRIGEQFMEGMPIGFEGMRAAVSRSAASVMGAAAQAASVVRAVGPSLVGPGQLAAAAYAGPAAGPTTNNFYLQGGDATPDGILRALSWQGLIGRKGR